MTEYHKPFKDPKGNWYILIDEGLVFRQKEFPSEKAAMDFYKKKVADLTTQIIRKSD